MLKSTLKVWRRKGLGLILVLALYSALVLCTFPIQRFWHSGIEFEQTTTALSHEDYGWLPFSALQDDYSHLPPGYSLLVYAAIEVTGWLEAGRLVSFTSLLFTLLIVYDVARRCYQRTSEAVLSVFFLTTSPLFFLLGGSINQESSMLLFSSLAIWVYLWGSNSQKIEVGLLLASVAVSFSTLCKQSGYFVLIPIVGHLLYQYRGRALRCWATYLLVGLPTATALAWLRVLQEVQWTQESISWRQSVLWGRSILNLGSRVASMGWTGIFTRVAGHFVSALPASNFLLAGIGMLGFNPKTDLLPLLWAIGGLTYYFLFLQGSVNHDHYLTLTLPGMSILAARGLEVLADRVQSRWGITAGYWIRRLVLLSIILILSASVLYSFRRFQIRYTRANRFTEIVKSEVGPDETLVLIGSELFFFLQPPPGQMSVSERVTSEDLRLSPEWDYIAIGRPPYSICNQDWTHYYVKVRVSDYCLLERKEDR